MYRFRILVVSLCVAVLSGCPSVPQPDLSLYGTGTHVGTLTLLRVDSSWAPNKPHTDQNGNVVGWKVAPSEERCAPTIGADGSECPPLRRFVPLRFKDDVEGLDISSARVDESEDVTVTLNYAFIKYFKEGGAKSPQGEIAMVISFDSGQDLREGYLVYSSQGQTFGSFLDFQDWPVIGPVKIKASNLSMRITIIELDQIQNERSRQFIRSLAQVVPLVAPSASGVVDIGEKIAETVISQNVDDVVFDQRFSLKRVKQNEVVYRSPLLYGKYVAISQEDRLANHNASKRTPFATRPPEIAHLRYDLYSDRLYRAYNYLPPMQKDTPPQCAGAIPATYSAVRQEWGPVPISGLQYVATPSSDCLPIYGKPSAYRAAATALNDRSASKRRVDALGFPGDGNIGIGPNVSCGLGYALGQIAVDSVRVAGATSAESQYEFYDSLLKAEIGSNGMYEFPYKVLQYPKADTVLAQYPQHTHLVFSIEESVGHAGKKYHERFPKFQEYLDEQIANAKNSTQIDQIADVFRETLIAEKAREFAVDAVRANPDDSTDLKVCRLTAGFVSEDSKAVEGNAYILNKIEKIKHAVFRDVDSVFSMLSAAPGAGSDYTISASGNECTVK